MGSCCMSCPASPLPLEAAPSRGVCSSALDMYVVLTCYILYWRPSLSLAMTTLATPLQPCMKASASDESLHTPKHNSHSRRQAAAVHYP